MATRVLMEPLKIHNLRRDHLKEHSTEVIKTSPVVLVEKVKVSFSIVGIAQKCMIDLAAY